MVDEPIRWGHWINHSVLQAFHTIEERWRSSGLIVVRGGATFQSACHWQCVVSLGRTRNSRLPLFTQTRASMGFSYLTKTLIGKRVMDRILPQVDLLDH